MSQGLYKALLVQKNGLLLNEFVGAESFEAAEKKIKKTYTDMQLVNLITKVPSEAEANKAEAKAEAEMLETVKIKAEAKHKAERKAKKKDK